VLIDLQDVCRTVGLVLGLRDPKPDDRLMEDLGAESMDLLNIVITLERKYAVSIDEAEAAMISTVRELYEVVVESPHDGTRPTDSA
jgi:acyl carrier protein